MQLFWIVLLNTIANTGFGVILPVMPILLQSHGFSVAGLSVPFVAIVLGRIVSKTFCATLAAKLQYRAIIHLSFIVYSVVFLLYIFAATKTEFIILRFIEGLFEGMIVVILTDITLTLSKQSNRGFYMGIFGASFGIGMVAGPIYGGMVLAKYGTSAIFITNAILGAVGFICTVFLNKYSVIKEEKLRLTRNLLKILTFYSPAILRRTYLFSFAIFLPLYCTQVIGMDIPAITKIFAMIAVALIILGPASGRIVDKLNCRLVTIWGTVGMSISCLMIFFGMHFFTFFTLMLIFFGITMPAGMKFFGDMVQNNPNRTQILGLAGSMTEVITLFVALFMPLVADLNILYPWLFLCVIGFIAVLPYISKIDSFVIDNTK